LGIADEIRDSFIDAAHFLGFRTTPNKRNDSALQEEETEEEETEWVTCCEPARSHRERFMEFHKSNPDVYKYLREFALVALHRGRRTSIKCLFERVRWEISIELREKPYRLNNSYTSLYARLLMKQEPQLRNFFVTRSLKEAA
jgi:hypothetical protein